MPTIASWIGIHLLSLTLEWSSLTVDAKSIILLRNDLPGLTTQMRAAAAQSVTTAPFFGMNVVPAILESHVAVATVFLRVAAPPSYMCLTR